jgi:hypothetical protein
MCESSIVSDDWVVKGCHIHVNGVELAVFDDYKGGVGFRPFFSSTPTDKGRQAVKLAYEVCLPDADVRRKWVNRLESARLFMLGYSGAMSSLANGRMAEFKFLRIAIERWKQ